MTRTLMIAAAISLLSTAAGASPIQFTFAATLTNVSTITAAGGQTTTVPYGTPYTVTGVTTGLDPKWLDSGQHAYTSESTWDFGMYGTATSSAFDYVEYLSDGALWSVALDRTWDPLDAIFPNGTSGLRVFVYPNLPFPVTAEPTPFGVLADFTVSQAFHPFTLATDRGNTITVLYDGRTGTEFTITSVTTEAVPEPATWLLVSVGLGTALWRRRRH